MAVSKPAGPEELAHLTRRLEDDGARTLEAFRALPPEAWEQQVYTTGGEWSVRMVLAHFVFAERALCRLMADVAAGGPGAPKDLDIDRFNETEAAEFRTTPAHELMSAFQNARQETVRLVRRFQQAELSHTGYHPWFGEVELRAMLKLVYRHNMIHWRDIRQAVESRAPVPHRAITPPTKAT